MSDEKSIGEYVNQFRTAVLGNSAHILSDSTLANRYYRKYVKSMRKLDELGNEGLSALAKLMDDDDLAVRVTTAAYLKHFETAKALKVLTAGKNIDRGIAMVAIVSLERWKRGLYLDPATGRETKIKQT